MKTALTVVLVVVVLVGCGPRVNRNRIDCHNKGGELVKTQNGQFVCAALVQ